LLGYDNLESEGAKKKSKISIKDVPLCSRLKNKINVSYIDGRVFKKYLHGT